MLHNIEPHQFDNSFASRTPKDDDYILHFHNDEVLLDCRTEEIKIPRYQFIKQEFPGLVGHDCYLFSIDHYQFYLLEDRNLAIPNGFCYKKLQIFRDFTPRWLGFAGISASHLYHWYDSHKFCGKCTAPLKKGIEERKLYCEKCGLIEYPKISPVIIVGITHKDKLLMTKYANGNYKNYALVAGFVEFGESLEDALRREVMEEVGLKVKNITYYKSQPWGFSDSLLAGFFADLDGSSLITLDENELSEAKWISRKELPVNNDSKISLTSDMIAYWRNLK